MPIASQQAGELELVLPDGSRKRVASGTTALAVAEGIGPRLARDAVGALLDGTEVDLRQPLETGGAFRLLTAKDPEAGPFIRHSAEHVLADAVTRLWPEALFDAGRRDHSEKFQYDFRFPRAFTPEDLEAIESKMREILAEDHEFERLEVSREEAERIFRQRGNDLKVERLADIPEGETITLFRDGEFLDLCRGPHVQRLSQIGVVKLLETSGAYFRGNESREMLQRVYGTAFASRGELDAYLEQLEQARARDHRRLGPELDLFSFHPEAPAMPFFHPKGAFVYRQLVDAVRELYREGGYEEVITPQILDVELWRKSGHLDNYREAMFFTEVEGRQFAVKPMNCPGHCLIYKTRLRSYRDLPLRYADFGRLHRNERSGVTSGLTRVRSFCQDDAHIFCTEAQVEEEVLSVVAAIRGLYATFGFEDLTIELSTRPAKRLGDEALWDRAEAALADALERAEIAYEVNAGDGAFYGPKIDFQIADVLGRSWQLGTIQLDFQFPERLDLTYVGSDGDEHRPVMIHRAMLGSLERFMGILIEHTSGALPVWLAPVQAVVLPVSEKFAEYAESIGERLRQAGLRVEVDTRGEKLGYRIRESQMRKVPYMLVAGAREESSGTVSVRLRSGEDQGAQEVDQVADAIARAAAERRASI